MSQVVQVLERVNHLFTTSLCWCLSNAIYSYVFKYWKHLTCQWTRYHLKIKLPQLSQWQSHRTNPIREAVLHAFCMRCASFHSCSQNTTDRKWMYTHSRVGRKWNAEKSWYIFPSRKTLEPRVKCGLWHMARVVTYGNRKRCVNWRSERRFCRCFSK